MLTAAAGLATVVATQAERVGQTPEQTSLEARSGEPPEDPVAVLNRAIQAGQVRVAFDGPRGYLTSVLKALDVPVESQTLVFSETSFQPQYIHPGNPRALYFNDTVAVGWVNGGDVLEVAALEPGKGMALYALDQQSKPAPQFERDLRCLQCHDTAFTAGVPGLLTMSMLPLSDNPSEYAQGWPVDHRTPIEDRWGGWFVTGGQVPRVHLGNVPVHRADRSYARRPAAPAVEEVDVDETYPSKRSDVAALLVLNHQTHMVNLLTRLARDARLVEHEGFLGGRVMQVARDLVDYLLFVDEAPLPVPVRGTSGFAEVFAARGPRDQKGRSLRELDLTTRLLRYRCSYLIYSPAFDALPGMARDAVYARMWRILSGEETDPKYGRLAAADRRAIVEILRDTKPDVPRYFDLAAIR
ncbi:MAG: hypothetical protein A3F70_15355 [Acidobacteria bacterium RIFCSPLOWO2_12_FULL_67_14]|nr:MAG: hypothetical protein A3F70_15355 [Acidobacteria bacterium RIFCSPLOWO2_12_FULL_67_14]